MTHIPYSPDPYMQPKKTNRTVWIVVGTAAAAVVATFAVVLAIGWFLVDGPGASADNVDIEILGTPEGRADTGIINRHAGIERCEFWDEQMAAGDRVSLMGPDGNLLGVTELRASDSFRSSLDDQGTMTAFCGFEATIPDVDTTAAAYTLQIGRYEAVPVSGEELRRDLLVFHVRGTFDVLANAEPIEVYTPEEG